MSKLIVTLFNRQFDFTDFAQVHPGGAHIIQKYQGKDATDAFYEAGHLHKSGIMEQLQQFEVSETKQPKDTIVKPQYIENYFEKIGLKPKL